MLDVRPWLLVFDLDGTLIDSSLDLCQAVNAALRHVGAPILSHALISSFIGDGALTLIQRALGQASPADDASSSDQGRAPRLQQTLDYFLEFYRVHKLDNTRLHEGVLDALTTLRAAQPDLLMAVLTNKPVHASREICAALDLAPFFFAIYGGNSFPTKKPDPLGLLSLITEGRALGGDTTSPTSTGAEGVYMIGDSATDILTARHAGARSLGCLYGLAPDSLETTPPELLCRSAREWPALLGFAPPVSPPLDGEASKGAS